MAEVEPAVAHRPSRPDRVLFWGRTYAGSGPLDPALEVVARCCHAAGLERQERRQLASGLVELVALQAAPERGALRTTSLQKVVWHIENRDGRLRLTSDFRMLRGSARRTVGLAVFVVLAFAASAVLDARGWFGGPRWLLALDVFLVIPAALLALRLVDRIGVLGGRRGDALWREVVAGIEALGGAVEPVGLDGGRRHFGSLLALLVGFLTVVVAWLVLQSLGTPWSWRPGGVLMLLAVPLLATIALLVIALVAMVRHRGFAERAISLHSGLATMLSAVFLVACPLLPSWLVARHFELSTRSPADPEMRVLAWLVLSASAILLAGALSLFVLAVRAAASARDSVLWRRRHAAWPMARAAAGDRDVVRRIRRIFFAVWAAFGVLLMVGVLMAVDSAVDALAPWAGTTRGNPVATSAALLAAAFGVPASSPWPSLAARSVWLGWSLLIVSLLALSAAQLGRARKQARRRLCLDTAGAGTSSGRSAGELVSDLGRTAGLPELRVALLDDSSIGGWSASFGPFGRERWVVLTSGAVEQLSRDELAALVAHEIAHHLGRHPVNDGLFRWLSRLTFAGDAFGRAIQHSFAYEEEADRRATALLAEAGFGGDGLHRLLTSMRHVAPLWGSSDGEGCDGPAASPAAVAAAAQAIAAGAPGNRPWRDWLLPFLAQYTSELDLHYWHPDYDQRLRAIAFPGVGEAARAEAGWDL